MWQNRHLWAIGFGFRTTRICAPFHHALGAHALSHRSTWDIFWFPCLFFMEPGVPLKWNFILSSMIFSFLGGKYKTITGLRPNITLTSLRLFSQLRSTNLFFVRFLEQPRLPNTKRQHNHLGNLQLSVFTTLTSRLQKGPWTHGCCFEVFIFFWFWIHTASAPSTAGTHTDGGAVIRKPGSAWLKGTPAMENELQTHILVDKQKSCKT